MADSLRIDIQHATIGRLNISADTSNKPLRNRRKEALHTVIERGDTEIIEAVRERRIHVSEVQRAVVAKGKGDYETLKRRAMSRAGAMEEAVDRAIALMAGSREPGTVQTYQVTGNALVAHFTAERSMDDITTEELHGFLYAGAWSMNTRSQMWIRGRRIWKLAGANPDVWAGVEKPRTRKTRVVFLKPAEWGKLVEANRDMPVIGPLALGCLGGLRVGEISHLRTDVDVDFTRRVVRVQPRGGKRAWKPKNDRAVRDVPMSEELEGHLLWHRRHYAGEHYFYRLPGRDEPAHINIIAHHVRAAMRKAGLVYGQKHNGFTTHSLRHTFASWLAQADVQLMKIAALLGDTPEIVASTYAHLTPRDLDRAVGVIDSTVRKSREAPTP